MRSESFLDARIFKSQQLAISLAQCNRLGFVKLGFICHLGFVI